MKVCIKNKDTGYSRGKKKKKKKKNERSTCCIRKICVVFKVKRRKMNHELLIIDA